MRSIIAASLYKYFQVNKNPLCLRKCNLAVMLVLLRKILRNTLFNCFQFYYNQKNMLMYILATFFFIVKGF